MPWADPDTAYAAFEIDGIDEGSRTGWNIIRGVINEITNPGGLRRLDALGLEARASGPKRGWMLSRCSGRACRMPDNTDAHG